METRYFDLRETDGLQEEAEIAAAADILRRGGLLGIPTETVYGLGANGLDPKAVKAIFEAKGRPQDNPLILHVAAAEWLDRYCEDVPPVAYALAEKFWPGPLTMILKRKPIVPDVTTAGLNTVGMRCPDHPVTLAIIRASGVPVAAPSANTSGRPSCTCAEDVREDMDGKIEGIVDGGPCVVGVESTIVDLTCEPPRLLRPGGLPLEDLEELIGHVDVDKAVTSQLKEGEKPRAPGMKYRHYAPKAPVLAVTGDPYRSAAVIRQKVQPGDGVICYDEFAAQFAEQIVQTLGPMENRLAHSQRVFDALRAFDTSPVTQIYAQCPDSVGLDRAVANRIKKAAGFQTIEAGCDHIVLGLTGGTGAGKTSALDAVRDLGGTVIDCDALYHEMLRTDTAMRQDIVDQFGDVFKEDGSLNREKLGKEVFSQPERLEKLNEIVYRHLVPELQRRTSGDGLYAIDAINLIESGAADLCHRTIAVTAPAEVRVRRIMARDGIGEEYARMRISAQKPDAYYEERCDCVLKNTAETPEAFRGEARGVLERMIAEIRNNG